jgi:N6-adenosine-specific RNA methylase IME4
MADPPWRFKNWSKHGERKNPITKYDCMSLEDIKALPVNQLAGRNCLLWLWGTHPMVREALDTMAAWGFAYVTSGVWVKKTVTGKLAFGTGYTLRSASEPFFVGRIGNPRTSRSTRTVIEGPVREHSRKPDSAYAAAEALVVDAVRKADLFSRESRKGWDAWGNEAGKWPRES